MAFYLTTSKLHFKVTFLQILQLLLAKTCIWHYFTCTSLYLGRIQVFRGKVHIASQNVIFGVMLCRSMRKETIKRATFTVNKKFICFFKKKTF